MKPRIILLYFLSVSIITILHLLIYASVQQSYRTAANDPQIQLADNIAMHLGNGKPISEMIVPDTINIANSLVVVSGIYDAEGHPLLSNGFLNGKMMTPPAAVFEYAFRNGENRVTWQPEKGVRIALVIVRSGIAPVTFVAVGRSLREVEIRESELVKMVIIAWLLCFSLLTIMLLLMPKNNRK